VPGTYLSVTSFGTAFSVGRQKMFFHQSAGTGGPADYMYDPVTDSWVVLTTNIAGPTTSCVCIFDETNDQIIAFEQHGSGSTDCDVWVGTLALDVLATAPLGVFDPHLVPQAWF
jgi:hypothetical protein